VSVVDNTGNVLSDTNEPDTALGLTQTQLEIRKKFEQYLSKKRKACSRRSSGPARRSFACRQKMNFDTVPPHREKFDPEGQVAPQLHWKMTKRPIHLARRRPAPQSGSKQTPPVKPILVAAATRRITIAHQEKVKTKPVRAQ
jgi:flagellar biosynthesis/type III secretory pathway M-ring protein FliF/YscJ